MTERQNFWGGWQERISALRNVPAVLKIVWDSGPGVVVFGLVSVLIKSFTLRTLLYSQICSCRGIGDILGLSPGSLLASGQSLMPLQGALGTRVLGCRWEGTIAIFDYG